ncbi:MAG: CRTAC1 family protein [Planctomycetota bacterium]|nr:CRTAC1 family protein [Planctomycetota bacterium]
MPTPGDAPADSLSPESPLPRTPPAVARPVQPDDWFEDVTERSGVRFAFRTGWEGGHYTVLESMGGGVAMLDYDGDSDLDIFFPGGGKIFGTPRKIEGRPPALYRNDGDGHFVDVTVAAGLGTAGDYTRACAVADFNCDGFPDLFVVCFGRSQLLRNNGDGTFREVAGQAGLVTDGFNSTAAWADVDRDGCPDLYVAAYLNIPPDDTKSCDDTLRGIRDVCGPWAYPGAPDRLFRNRGDGTFEEITRTAGLSDEGKGLGVVAADVNQDGWIDFYVANDTTDNHLYLGGPGLRFQEAGLMAGVATNENGTAQGSMGVDFGDYDGDGHGDLWVTNYEREDDTLYRWLSGASFSNATLAVGLGGISRPYVGFGTGFVDFDSDGWLDLFVINGHVLYHRGEGPYQQPAMLFRNRTGQTFQNVTASGGPYFSIPHAGRGAAYGDLDNDGAPDLVVVHQNDPVVLLRNRLTPRNWIRTVLRGIQSNPDAVGAAVSLEYQGRKLVRFVNGGGGYASHADRRILFPNADGQPRDVTVRWPSGKTEVFRDVPVCRTSLLIEGAGESEP